MIEKLKKNVCKISVSGLKETQQGTGFLISNKLIMTAYHVLEGNNKLGEIKVHFNDDIYSVTLHKFINEEYKILDVAILELKEEVDFYQNINFLDKKLNSNEKWITRGYPLAKDETGEELTHRDCVIHQHLDELSSGNYDIELNLHGKLDSYSGLSGSPIIVDEKIVGFLTKELSDSRVKEFRGLSFKYFKELINEVNRKEQNKNEIRESFDIELVKVELEDKTLYVGKYPVTFEEYDLFCEDMNLKNPDCYFYPEKRKEYPVVNISWDNVIMYCAWLNKKATIFEYSLPTSREWDSIAMKNLIQKDKLDEYIWHQLNTTTIQMVGTKKSGLLGIHDMYGNIWEWCSDSYDDEYRIIKGNSYNRLFKELDIEEDYFLQNNSKSELGFRIIAKKIVD